MPKILILINFRANISSCVSFCVCFMAKEPSTVFSLPRIFQLKPVQDWFKKSLNKSGMWKKPISEKSISTNSAELSMSAKVLKNAIFRVCTKFAFIGHIIVTVYWSKVIELWKVMKNSFNQRFLNMIINPKSLIFITFSRNSEKCQFDGFFHSWFFFDGLFPHPQQKLIEKS